MKQKINFITYGDSKKYEISKKHILNLAKHSGFFNECLGMSKKDINLKFKNSFEKILSEKRGGGYYIWKIPIIQQSLESLNEGDLLVYSDSGSSFNFYAKKRFFEYVDLINDSNFGNLRFESKKSHIEKNWTSREIFEYFNIDIDSDVGDSIQLLGGHLIFKKNEHTDNFFNIFLKLLRENPLLVTDFYKEDQIDQFVENRHDQSIMSIISKKFGGVILENETFFEKDSPDQHSYPFLSVRHYGHGFKDKIKYRLGHKRSTPIYF